MSKDMPFFSKDHPCNGKTCKDCETCIFDEPIPDKPIGTRLRCDECGYLMISYNESGKTFTASCAKWLIDTDSVSRARVIERGVDADRQVFRPDWCPKVATAVPTDTQPYNEYTEKRRKILALPSISNWKDIKAGDICVVPRILKQKRKILLVKERNEFVLKCVLLNDNLEQTMIYTNIYSNDTDVKFIVKIHKF